MPENTKKRPTDWEWRVSYSGGYGLEAYEGEFTVWAEDIFEAAREARWVWEEKLPINARINLIERKD